MANKVNTTYSANLGTSNVKVQPTQAITPTKIDTSYQGNSNALYGGHDATWWQNQYARQAEGHRFEPYNFHQLYEKGTRKHYI